MIYILFFISGAVGLVYEVVWTRMLVLIFGSTTHTVVAVLSVFMLGLALGSYIFGRLADMVRDPIRLYAILEIGIGLTAFLASWMIGSWWILILVPTTLMGGTFPVVVKYFKQSAVGWVYGVNTLGALAGAVFTAFVLIEILGLNNSITLAVGLNVTIGLSALFIKRRIQKEERKRIEKKVGYPKYKLVLAAIAFGVSGMVAMAYEVLWTRILTPMTGTYIYSFAMILAVVLFGIAAGSLIGKRLEKIPNRLLVFGLIEFGIGVGALLSILIIGFLEVNIVLLLVIIAILPAAVFMGMTFPIILGLPVGAKQEGHFVGQLYAINTVGSLVGPSLAGFMLIPMLGTGRSIAILAMVSLTIGIVFLSLEKRRAVVLIPLVGIATLFVLTASGNLFLPESMKIRMDDLKKQGISYQYLEDDTASVLAYPQGLIVDGQIMTSEVDETKLMAHIPLAMVSGPTRALVVCFGMGTTFRSALAHGIKVDAIDLVPSVPKVFSEFYADTENVLANPNGQIFIEDGRNYVLRSKEKYDVITVDPPPPVNSAGTTILYSEEFYRQGAKLLNPGGIMSQWLFYGTRRDDYKMLVRSFVNVFPYVAVFRSPNSAGLFLLGSKEQITMDWNHIDRILSQPKVKADLSEWNDWNLDRLKKLYYGNRSNLVSWIGPGASVTDSHPLTEYYLVRRLVGRLTYQEPVMGDKYLP